MNRMTNAASKNVDDHCRDLAIFKHTSTNESDNVNNCTFIGDVVMRYPAFSDAEIVQHIKDVEEVKADENVSGGHGPIAQAL